MHFHPTSVQKHTRHVLIAATLCALLPTAVQAEDSSFAKCFKLKSGVMYDRAFRSNVQIVEAKFQGKPAFAVVNQDEGAKMARFFDLTGRKALGSATYGMAAWGGDPNKIAIEEINLAPVPQFPADAQPGDTFHVLNGGTATTTAGGTKKDTTQGKVTYTFVGYEDLNVKLDNEPHVFRNACHLRVAREGKGSFDSWYVSELGEVKLRITDKDGRLLINEEIKNLKQ